MIKIKKKNKKNQILRPKILAPAQIRVARTFYETKYICFASIFTSKNDLIHQKKFELIF